MGGTRAAAEIRYKGAKSKSKRGQAMSIIRFLALGALGVFLATAAGPAVAAELRVRVTQLQSNDGGVHFALYATAESFPKKDDRSAGAEVEAKARDLMAPVLGKDQADGLIEAVRASEKLSDARELRRWLAA